MPATLAVTSISATQLLAAPPEAAGRMPPLNTMVLPPLELMLPPVQVVVGFAPAGMVTPAGSTSLTAMSASGCASGLMKVMRTRLRAPGAITSGMNCLLTPTLAWVCRLVEASSVLLTPWSVVTAPTGISSRMVPTWVVETLTVTVQVLPAVMLAPDSSICVPSAVALTTPPLQVVEAFGVAAMIMPVSVPPEVPPSVK